MTIAVHGLREEAGDSLRDTDTTLVAALRRGDPDAFVFEAVFNCIDRFEGRAELVVWIYGIARNIINNRLRRRGGVRLLSLSDLPPEAGPIDLGPQPLAEAREVLHRVRQAIEELPPEQRRILELRHGERLAIREIASRLGRSEDAVKSSLYRARRALAACLPPEHASLTF
jgi:RNA polymerase sigma-70 factor (ECF subfamily)